MKQKKYIFILLLFAVYVGFFLLNVMRGKPVCILDFPNGGTRELYTVHDNFINRYNDNSLYIWKWEQIQGKPLSAMEEQDGLYWLSPKVVIDYGATLTFSRRKSLKDVSVISIFAKELPKYIKHSKNGRFVGFVTHNETTPDQLDISIYETHKKEVIGQMFAISVEEGLGTRDIALSEDGRYMAVFARYQQQDVLMLVDLKRQNLLWKKEFTSQHQLVARLGMGIFSPDSEFLYAGWIDYHVYQFSVQDGAIQKKLYMLEKRHTQKDRLDFSAIDISSDGRYLATSDEPFGIVSIWDLQGVPSIIQRIKPNYTHIRGIAFSPDSKLLATGGFRPADKIKIWEIKR